MTSNNGGTDLDRATSLTEERVNGRLGIYADAIYLVSNTDEGSRVSVDRASLLFACEVGRRFDALVLFGRSVPSRVPADYLLPPDVELVKLPHYANLSELIQVGRAALRTLIEMWRGLPRTDVVWVWGPHPFSVLFAALALLQRKRVVLCIRQNTLSYFRTRLPSKRWLPVLGPVWLIEAGYRLLARWVPTTAVGAEVARRYGSDRPSLLPMAISLVRAKELAAVPPERDWTGPITLLTVGRLEPEKNPLLMLEALARLDGGEPGRYRLIWTGRGRLADEVRRSAGKLGISHLLELTGYIPFGSELLDIYRGAHMFVHISLTEGVPQVLIEALATATPVIATDVGGVSAILDHGRAGLLIPPDDVDAIVGAVRRMVTDHDLREVLLRRGLELARALTLEAQADGVARFIRGSEES